MSNTSGNGNGSRSARPVILLEFNELCPSLTTHFMAQGKLPNFRRLYAESQVFLTDAEEKAPNLEPWIQWTTVHCGLPFREHGVFHLGDGPKLRAKCVWDLLSDAGLNVWVCGSMNIKYDPGTRGWMLPDPWTTGVSPHPKDLEPYYRFVQMNVQEHSNDRVPLSKADYARFLSFMVQHGLSITTLNAILRQLLSERGGKNRWKRAVILDKLQFDVFRAQYQRLRPAFSTFFLNSTAHFQHVHWREMEPERFAVKPAPEEQAEYQDAILFGYQQMDGLVGRFLDLAGDHATLVFATALSQQPCLIYEEKGGKVLHRPRDFEPVLAFAGVTEPHRVSPVMAEEFHVHFENERDAASGLLKLQALRVIDRPALTLERNGSSVFGGCRIFTPIPNDAALTIADSPTARLFFELFYRIEGMKSGMHHPDGMLWLRAPERSHAVHSEKVSLLSIAPTILDMFGLPAPAHMRGPVLGRAPEMAGVR